MSAFNSMVAPGSGDALQQAIARRQGMGGAASSTVSPGAPTFDPSTQPPTVPQGNPMQTGGSAPMPAPQSLPTPQSPGTAPMSDGNPDTKIILGAMKERLSHINKMESTQVGAQY